MEDRDSKLTGKQIAEKYRFSKVENLDRKQTLIAFKELHKLYSDRITEIEILEARIKYYEQRIIDFEKSQENKITQYDPKWFGVDKVIYILKKNSKVMLTSEIQTELLRLEPYLKQKWTNPYSAIIGYISRGIKFGRIVRSFKIGAFGYTYGLPEWTDDEQKLIRSYSY